MLSQVLVLMLVATVVSSKSIDKSASFEETERVIGGQDAAVGDFPYTVEDTVLGAETKHVTGRQTADPGQFPWAVALYSNNQFICTASIISPTTVLTAAHCVELNGYYRTVESFYAIANVSKSAENVRINFASHTLHPEYDDQNMDNDVAVFKTSEEIPFSDEVKNVCIAGPNTRMYQYKKATAMGWGKTTHFTDNSNDIPDRLQYAEQYIVLNSVCTWVNDYVNTDKICATGFFNGVCYGDSGGPLVHLSVDKPPVEIGITSYVSDDVGCGEIVPAVFTRVSSQYDFIMRSANDASICIV